MNPFSKTFDELEAGERFTTRGRTISESDIERFAQLSWDTHPVHTDEEWAASSRFDGRIAHGMLLLSFASGLMPYDPERVVALRGMRDATFKAPVRPGATIRVEVELKELRELDDEHGLVTFGWRVMAGESLAARATVDALWRRGEPSPAPDQADESSEKPVAVPL